MRQNSISSPNDLPIKNCSPRKSIISPYKSKSNAKRQIEPASFIKVQKNKLSTANRLL